MALGAKTRRLLLRSRSLRTFSRFKSARKPVGDAHVSENRLVLPPAVRRHDVLVMTAPCDALPLRARATSTRTASLMSKRFSVKSVSRIVAQQFHEHSDVFPSARQKAKKEQKVAGRKRKLRELAEHRMEAEQLHAYPANPAPRSTTRTQTQALQRERPF